MNRTLIAEFSWKFQQVRRESESAISQLDAGLLRKSLDGELNSVAVIMKHVGGNLRSRFGDFLTQDGEKPWRDRESEFIDDFPPGEPGRFMALERWRQGWETLDGTLATLHDTDLVKIVRIRGVEHTVSLALLRALSHVSYHQGQITLLARALVGPESWRVISIPRGGTNRRHHEMGFDPEKT